MKRGLFTQRNEYMVAKLEHITKRGPCTQCKEFYDT